MLENSPQLAFLHGAFAQLVFAVLVCSAAIAAPGWAALETHRSESVRGVWRLALAATGVVYVQILIGAWYRHGLRPEPLEAVAGRLHLHLMGAVIVFGTIAALSARLRAAIADGRTPQAASQRLERDRKWLIHLLAVQVVIGFLAWMTGGRGEAVGAFELVSTILHVLGGALLLARTLLLTLRTRRLGPLGEPAHAAGEVATGGLA